MNTHTTINDKPESADPKRVRILEGALQAFLAHGFQRSTMDDIARAAEVSRPALYLVFKNKTDIYRALAREYLERSMAGARQAIAVGESVEEKLKNVIGASLEMLEPIEASPHGAEILDMKNSLAGDLIADWRSEMTAILTTAISDEAKSAGSDLAVHGLAANDLAVMLMDSLEGMKERGGDLLAPCRGIETNIRIIALALRP